MTRANRERWSIQVHKDYLKFSAAHFLIFPDGTAERMHGHNYKVYLELQTRLDGHGLVVNFKEIKPMVRELCDWLDEHILIPGQHPVLRTEPQADDMLEVRYRQRRYLLPRDEVIVLPISNSSAENLATFLGRTLRDRIRARWPDLVVQRLQIGVEETPGQRGVYRCDDCEPEPPA